MTAAVPMRARGRGLGHEPSRATHSWTFVRQRGQALGADAGDLAEVVDPAEPPCRRRQSRILARSPARRRRGCRAARPSPLSRLNRRLGGAAGSSAATAGGAVMAPRRGRPPAAVSDLRREVDRVRSAPARGPPARCTGVLDAPPSRSRYTPGLRTAPATWTSATAGCLGSSRTGADADRRVGAPPASAGVATARCAPGPA